MYQSNLFIVLILLLGLWSPDQSSDKAQELIDAAIAAHGSDLLVHSVVDFNFRGHSYHVEKDGWRYEAKRSFTDDAGQVIEDRHDKKGIFRKINGSPIDLDEKTRGAIETAMNSVVYFAYLPLKLNDPAVQKEYAGKGEIDGEVKERVKVTFEKEGGGKDHEDVFMFWFDPISNQMTHLAYYFHVNGGGARFREAVNTRRVGGVLFSDYLNFSADLGMDLEKFESAEYRTQSSLLSTIELENIKLRKHN